MCRYKQRKVFQKCQNRQFSSWKLAVLVRVARLVTFSFPGEWELWSGRRPAGDQQLSTGQLHWTVRVTPHTKQKSRFRKSGIWIFGPSGETRTRGILVPKNCRNIFLIFSVRFWRFPLRIPCFPNLSSPLLPRVPELSMVKNVVKTASQNSRQFFRRVWEAVSFRDCSLERKIMQVIFFHQSTIGGHS